jgi:hypothetical protein
MKILIINFVRITLKIVSGFELLFTHGSKINVFIISMTKLLDADWLRGVQLFPKQTKWRKGILNTSVK